MDEAEGRYEVVNGQDLVGLLAGEGLNLHDFADGKFSELGVHLGTFGTPAEVGERGPAILNQSGQSFLINSSRLLQQPTNL